MHERTSLANSRPGSVLYLCRGHGFAHAARTRVILDNLRARYPSLPVVLASAGDGVTYFNLYGQDCIDLRFPDQFDHTAVARAPIQDFLLHHRADACHVVSDELCLVPRISADLKLSCTLIVCSFSGYTNNPNALDYIGSADDIILANWAEAVNIPKSLGQKAIPVGPIVPSLPDGKATARRRLGIGPEEFLATVALGAFSPHKKSYLQSALQLILRAWSKPSRKGQLVVLANQEDGRLLCPDLCEQPCVSWVGRTNQASLYYRASDTVYSAGSSVTAELIKNDIPTVIVRPVEPSNTGAKIEYLNARTSSSVAVAKLCDSPGTLWRLAQLTSNAPARTGHPQLRWSEGADIVDRLARYFP